MMDDFERWNRWAAGSKESQRDSGQQPRVARNGLPWVKRPIINISNRNAVAAIRLVDRLTFATTALRLNLIANLNPRKLANLGLEDAIPLGLENKNAFVMIP
jgi:hypothetical protein